MHRVNGRKFESYRDEELNIMQTHWEACFRNAFPDYMGNFSFVTYDKATKNFTPFRVFVVLIKYVLHVFS